MCRSVEPALEEKRASQLWCIHGVYYDLAAFMKNHPGGAGVLSMTRGKEDLTAMFESYHALAHMEGIRATMKKYEFQGKVVDDVQERERSMMRGLDKQAVGYLYRKGGFYDTLRNRVKAHFLKKYKMEGADPRASSINRFIKVNRLWYLKILLQLAVYVPLYLAMLGVDVGLGAPTLLHRCALGFVAGALLQCISFCILHDASHYGLWFNRPAAQEAVARVSCAWTLWNASMWAVHHVYGHHSFTGDPERDPDLVHARPFIKKHAQSPDGEYMSGAVRMQRWLTPFFMLVLPGQTIGQTISYFRGWRQGHIWRLPVNNDLGEFRWYECATYTLQVGSHFWGANLLASFVYFAGISACFHLGIAPDHDTFESAVVNSIERKRELMASGAGRQGGIRKEDGAEDKGKDKNKNGGGSSAAGHDEVGDDWGEVQVRHSGNFSMDSPLVTQMMGGINYQIEHHLFPSMSHMHYWEVAPIVKRVCKEWDIPYNAHPTILSAYKSYIKNLTVLAQGVTTSPAPSQN